MSSAIRVDDIEICMLLKNEELLIETSLFELKKYFSKFSIIDQGSTDRTIEIVCDMIGGHAKIAKKPRNYILETGFARARNELTLMCELPWVFHIDADEQLASGVEAGLIETDPVNNALSVFHVERRNLARPPERPASLSPHYTSQLPVMSVEKIPRIYDRNLPLFWKSFIHEEIVSADTLLGCASTSSKIVLNHLSHFKNEDSQEYKEELYGWMIMKGANETGFDQDRLSGYSKNALENNLDYFKEMARRFSLRTHNV